MRLNDDGQPSPRVDVALTLDHFSTVERAVLMRCMREMKMEENALGQAVAQLSRRKRGIAAGTRSQLVSARDWQRCGFVTEYMRPLRWNESMVALLPSAGRIRFFNFVRQCRESCFSPRHAKILELMSRELALLPETRLAPMSGESLLLLPGRLRQVLMGIVVGDNEKQIALSLGISRNTVHEYVRRLFERFGVSGRGALVARVGRHLHAVELAQSMAGLDYWYFEQSIRPPPRC
jgi:DNA-binding CsgD family transcriptional regulator